MTWHPAVGLLAVTLLVADPQPLQLSGLERIYFVRVEPPSAPAPIPALLPAVLVPAPEDDELREDVQVSDLDLGLPDRRVVLREIVDHRHGRFEDTWWAVYDGGRRGGVWRFSPDAGRAEGKALGNVRIDGISLDATGRLQVRLAGGVARPQGALSITGKVMTLDRTPDGFAFAQLRNAFGFFRGYDAGETPQSTAVATEREHGDGFEERTLDLAPADVLHACGFRDPDSGVQSAPPSFEALERIAVCVTASPGHRVVRRLRHEPSFSERGGR